jgi:hypothetical protein
MTKDAEYTTDFAFLMHSMLILSTALRGESIRIMRDVISQATTILGEDLTVVYTFYDNNEDRFKMNLKNISAIARPMDENVKGY